MSNTTNLTPAHTQVFHALAIAIDTDKRIDMIRAEKGDFSQVLVKESDESNGDVVEFFAEDIAGNELIFDIKKGEVEVIKVGSNASYGELQSLVV